MNNTSFEMFNNRFNPKNHNHLSNNFLELPMDLGNTNMSHFHSLLLAKVSAHVKVHLDLEFLQNSSNN